MVCAAFTPDSKHLLSGSRDKGIRLWDGRSGAFIKELARQDADVESLSVSLDRKWVVTGAGVGANYHLNRFAIPSGEWLSRFTEHQYLVNATAISPDGRLVASGGELAPSPDGRRLVSGSDDQTVRLWSLEDGRPLLTLFARRDGQWLAWTLNGYYTASLQGERMIGWHINQSEDQAAASTPPASTPSGSRSQRWRPGMLATGGDLEREDDRTTYPRPTC